MLKKILIFHTAVGLGHKYIAQNIGWHLQQAGFEVKVADIGKVQKGRFEKYTVGAHQFINRYLPFVWGWLYRWGHYVILPFRTIIAGFNYQAAKALVDEYNPDLIITTQTTASAVIAYLKKKGFYKNLFAIAFSDYHLHPYWLYKQADFYLANTEEQKQEMVKQGISEKIIYVCGIVLKPKADVNVREVRQKLGVKNEEKVILIGTGSLGLGFKEKDLDDLSKLKNTKIIFACGKNTELYKKIENLSRGNIIPLGFYEPMDELYSIADIFIGKPGGLSTAEALRWNLSLLVTFTLPGQEEKNVTYLAQRKLIITRPKNLALAVAQELASHNFRKQLLLNPNVGEIIGGAAVLTGAVKMALEKPSVS